MVEGGILAPIFAMMMMMTVYLGGVYQTKYDSFMKARYKTWSYGSNACTNPDGVGDVGTDGQATNSTNPPSQSSQGSGSQAQGRSDATQAMFIGHGYDEEKWDYAPTYRFYNNGPQTIRTDGWVVCNEKNYGHNPFSYIGGIFSQALGGM
jgi:hypothetical protein